MGMKNQVLYVPKPRCEYRHSDGDYCNVVSVYMNAKGEWVCKTHLRLSSMNDERSQKATLSTVVHASQMKQVYITTANRSGIGPQHTKGEPSK